MTKLDPRLLVLLVVVDLVTIAAMTTLEASVPVEFLTLLALAIGELFRGKGTNPPDGDKR